MVSLSLISLLTLQINESNGYKIKGFKDKKILGQVSSHEVARFMRKMGEERKKRNSRHGNFPNPKVFEIETSPK